MDKEDPRVEVLDPFKIPMKSDFVRHSGKSFVRTVQGFYKPIYLVLMNTELYVYASHSATKHDDMYALGQNMGIEVRALEPIPQTAELIQQGITWQNYEGGDNKLYPIELDLAIFSQRNYTGKLNLFFVEQDQASKWLEALL